MKNKAVQLGDYLVTNKDLNQNGKREFWKNTMKRIFWVILICISGYLFLIRTHFMVNASLSTPTLSEEEPELTTSGSCPSGNVWSITDFGANGNDTKDDYDALLKAAKCASNKENITLYFPAGHYYIKQYRITGATSDGRQPNGVKNIVFNNCKGLRIIGAGKSNTTIDGKGNYKMTQDYQSWNGHEYNWNSYSMNVIPFWFNNCKDVYLDGFEIDGNFDQTTVDPRGIDQPHTSIGVFVHGTLGFTLANLNVHHWAEDGVYLGGGNIDRNGFIYQVDSHHNGRQGMSITNARGVTVVNSSFKDTGYAVGKRFAPGCGVDIEPDEDPIDEPNNRTGDILFVQNQYGRNWGGGGGGGGFEKGQPDICHYPGGLGSYNNFLPNNSPVTLSETITYPLNLPPGERTSDYSTFFFSQSGYAGGAGGTLFNIKLVSGNVKINVNTSGMRTIQYFLDGDPITGVVTAGSVTINTTQYANGRHLLYASATTTSGPKTYDPILLIIANVSDQSSTPTPSPTPLAGDLNHDNKVNDLDYNILVADFNKTGSPGWIPADIDKNGKVDIFDHNVLVGNYEK